MLKDKFYWPIVALILATLLKALVWISVVPIWHTPDEQAHFATIQNFAEGVIKPSYKGLTHSEELIISERFLDTERGSKRRNKFTFNPNYKIEYVTGAVGKHEEEIKNLAKSTRTNMLEKEMASYYPLYYQAGKVIYQIFYNFDLLTRVFVVRLFSIFPILGVTLLSYLAAKEIFPKEKYLHLTVPILTSFHPMMTFLNAGVTNDGLNIFLFTAFIYFSILSIKKGLDFKNLVAFSIILGLGQITRPQFLIALPLFAVVFIYDFFVHKRSLVQAFAKILVFIPIVIVTGGWFTLQKALGNFFEQGVPLPYFETPQTATSVNLSFITHLKNSLIQTDQQTFYWYWGVFKWLSLVYPAVVNQILKGITVISAIGGFFWVLKVIKSKDFSKTTTTIVFLLVTSIFFVLNIFFVDWRHIVTNGFSLGVQGRYFLPTVLAHMILLTVGMLVLVPAKFQRYISFVLSLAMIILNSFALFWIGQHYYYISRGDLLDQISQYKPIFFKSPLLEVYFGFYILSLFLLIWYLVKISFFVKK